MLFPPPLLLLRLGLVNRLRRYLPTLAAMGVCVAMTWCLSLVSTIYPKMPTVCPTTVTVVDFLFVTFAGSAFLHPPGTFTFFQRLSSNLQYLMGSPQPPLFRAHVMTTTATFVLVARYEPVGWQRSCRPYPATRGTHPAVPPISRHCGKYQNLPTTRQPEETLKSPETGTPLTKTRRGVQHRIATPPFE